VLAAKVLLSGAPVAENAICLADWERLAFDGRDPGGELFK